MGDGGGRRSIGNESSRDGSDLTTVDTTESLKDGLVLGVAEGLASGILVSVESVDGS